MSASPLLRFVSLWLLSLLLAAPVQASVDGWDQGLIEAAKAVASGTHSNRQLAQVLARNREINQLAIAGKITDAAYQRCQGVFVEESVSIGKRVAGEVGVGFTTQTSKSAVYKAGTDSDYITGATKAEQVAAMQQGYNREFSKRIQELDPKAGLPEGTNWISKNDIDFMGDASKASAEEFDKIASLNNAAYTRPGAARYEAFSRQKTGQALNLSDSIDYVDEMQEMLHHREHMIETAQQELAVVEGKLKSASLSATERELLQQQSNSLQVEIFKNKAIQGKYLDRISDATANLKQLLPPDSPLVTHGGSQLPGKASTRSMINNRLNPELLATRSKTILGQQLQEHIEVMAAVAQHDPSQAAQMQAAIAKYSQHLSAQQKAEVLDAVRKGLGRDAERNMAAIFRNSRGVASGGIDEAISAIKSGGDELADALARNDGVRVRSILADMKENFDQAYRWANLDADSSVKGMSQRLLEMSDDELEMALGDPALRSQLDEVLRAARMDADLLGVLTQSSNARQRLALKGMLAEAAETRSVWGKLRSVLGSIYEQLPIEQALQGLFAYWDALASLERQAQGDVDGAARKAFEGLMSLFSGVSPAVMAVITNTIIDATKEAGYDLAVASQDCEDLLARIISVKGLEHADGREAAKEYTLGGLAGQVAREADFRRILDTLIRDAATGEDLLVDEGKEAALQKKCAEPLVGRWRQLRTTKVMNYIRELSRLETLISALPLSIRFSPAQVELPATGQASEVLAEVVANDPAALNAVDEQLQRLQGLLQELGGKKGLVLLSLRHNTRWLTPPGMSLPEQQQTLQSFRQQAHFGSGRIRVDKEGPYALEAELSWQLITLSAIAEGGDFQAQRLNTRIVNPALNKQTSRWEFNLNLNPLKWFTWSEQLIPGDPVATYANELDRSFATKAEGWFTVTTATDRPEPPEKTQEKTPKAPTEIPGVKPGQSAPVQPGSMPGSAQEKPLPAVVVATPPIQNAGSRPASTNKSKQDQEAGQLTIPSTVGKPPAPVSTTSKPAPATTSATVVPPAAPATPPSNIPQTPPAEAVIPSPPPIADPPATTKGDAIGLIDFAAHAKWLDDHLLYLGRLQDAHYAAAHGRSWLGSNCSGGVNLEGENSCQPGESHQDCSQQVRQQYDGNVKAIQSARDELSAVRNTIQWKSESLAFRVNSAEAERVVAAMRAIQGHYGPTLFAGYPGGQQVKYSGCGQVASSAVKGDAKAASQEIPAIAPVAVTSPAPETTEPASKPNWSLTGLSSAAIYGSTTVLKVAPTTGGYRFVWQSSPALSFDPPTSSNGTSRLSFDRMGPVKVWCEIQGKKDGAWVTLGETTQQEVTVTAPQFSLQFTPADGQGRVGQSVRARIHSQPAVPAQLIDYRWIEPPSSNRMEIGGNAAEIEFQIKDTKPIALQALARVPQQGDEIANITGRYSGSGYTVAISEPVTRGPRLQQWVCNTQLGGAPQCGMQEIPQGQLATFQDLFFQANVTPAPAGPLRYQWRVDPQGSCGQPGSGQELRLNCSQPGSYRLQLKVLDGDNLLLGEASRAVAVTLDARKIQAEAASASQRKAACDQRLAGLVQGSNHCKAKEWARCQALLQQALQGAEQVCDKGQVALFNKARGLLQRAEQEMAKKAACDRHLQQIVAGAARCKNQDWPGCQQELKSALADAESVCGSEQAALLDKARGLLSKAQAASLAAEQPRPEPPPVPEIRPSVITAPTIPPASQQHNGCELSGRWSINDGGRWSGWVNIEQRQQLVTLNGMAGLSEQGRPIDCARYSDFVERVACRVAEKMYRTLQGRGEMGNGQLKLDVVAGEKGQTRYRAQMTIDPSCRRLVGSHQWNNEGKTHRGQHLLIKQ